jgi:hypothetical protein
MEHALPPARNHAPRNASASKIRDLFRLPSNLKAAKALGLTIPDEDSFFYCIVRNDAWICGRSRSSAKRARAI